MKIKKKIFKGFSIRELQKQGFKKTKIKGLYVSKNGKAYNVSSNRFLTITRKGNVIIERKAYNFAKIIIETFRKIENRSGQINFINSNCKDFKIENLEYKSTIMQPPPKNTDLLKCIRLYFEVSKKFTKSNILFKYYLNEIIKIRRFDLKYNDLEFRLFLKYFSNTDLINSSSQSEVFKKNDFTIINGKNAINKYLNLLIVECFQDLENGILKIKEFEVPPPRKKSLKRKLKSYYEETKHLINEPPK